jgi:hypothetical protein
VAIKNPGQTMVSLIPKTEEMPILRIAKTIQAKFRRIEQTNAEIERLKMRNKEVSSMSEQKEINKQLQSLLDQNTGDCDSIGKSLQIMDEEVKKS